MNDFKVGDEAWFWDFPEDGCGGFDVDAVDLKVSIIQNEHHLASGYLGHAYKSRAAATIAMIRRIGQQFDRHNTDE